MRAIEVIAAIGDANEKIRYYLVGDGPQSAEIKQKIKEVKLDHVVTMCGALTNPFGYMKAADLLLIPSYEEAAPMVIGEAASLGTPILSTLTSSAEDMVKNRGIGWVCENSLEGLIWGLKNAIEHPDAIAEKKQILAMTSHNNEEAIAQFDTMIG